MKDGKENYITNLDAWRMETVKISQDAPSSDQVNYNDMPPAMDASDDLPF